MRDRQDPSAYRRRVAASFDRTAPSYGTGGDVHQRFAERLVELADPLPGQRVLDVAAGTAPAAPAAAGRVGTDGLAVGLDLSLRMLRHARRNVAATGATNVVLLAGDAERLPFAAERFDMILCASSIVWLPDILAALREWHRAIKPGGRLASSCLASSCLAAPAPRSPGSSGPTSRPMAASCPT